MSGAVRPEIAVVGAGPAGLMAAEVLAAGGAAVTVYDRMPAPGRKLLLAGRGGLNLTHTEELPRFLTRYGAAPRVRAAIEAFPPQAMREWSEGLGQPTFVGTSGRIFPKTMKASPLLRAWLRRLAGAGVAFEFRHRWLRWTDDGALLFESKGARIAVRADAAILALGGASWPRLGSDGAWAETLTQAGIAIAPLRPSNCGFVAGWSDVFRDRFEGEPLKRIALSFGGEVVRGEALVTRAGIEGGAVYALSAALRDAIAAESQAELWIALRPDLPAADLQRKLAAPRGKQSLSNFLRKAVGLPPVAIGLMHEAALSTQHSLAAMTPPEMAELINAVPIRLTGTAPIATAISTAGGVRFEDIDEGFMLQRHPGVFVAGEMLDWEAPTGGYLLQASCATGVAAARGALAWLARKTD